MDRSLRLRLHVRRNGLPENNILFNVPLANDPTVADLLELVNETIPLEDADGEWGLDDYVVEVHDKAPHGQGNAFECLHFQSLAGLLDKDDEIFIRPLLTLDLKKRRLSGRNQILPGGEHIIDGVPFGRPRLRVPRCRPPVAIAPRKRRRLLDDKGYCADDDDDEAPGANLADDDDYSDSVGQLGDDDGASQLLLTRHGESDSRPRRHVRFTSGRSPGSDEASDDEVSSLDEEDGRDEDEDMVEPDFQELADEAADLRRELMEEEDNRLKTRSRSRRSTNLASDHPIRHNGPNATDFGPLRDVQDVNQTPSALDVSTSDPALFDKVVAVRSAFNVSHTDAVKLLLKHNKDVSEVWRALERSLKPRQGLAETMVLATQLELPREVQIISSPVRSPAEALGDISRIDEDEPAESSSRDEEDASDDSEAVSSDKESLSAEAMDSNNDDESDSPFEYVSARPSPTQDDVVNKSSSSDSSDDSSSDSQEDDSSSNSQEANASAKSTKVRSKKTKTQQRFNVSPKQQQDDSSDSSDSNDSSSEEETPITLRAKGRQAHKILSSDADSDSSSDSSSNSSSDSSSDGSDSGSSSETGSDSKFDEATTMPTVQSQSCLSTVDELKSPTGSKETATRHNALVPPGQGLTRTQRRNQRRRLQKKAALQPPNGLQNTQDTPIKEDDLEMKKRALLKTLKTVSSTLDQGEGQVLDVGKMEDQERSAWKRKISYRAVECVQEDIELGEPPFPFVQRWDPQQRWESQPSQRRGKRKARADSQFYNGSASQSTKKRRFGQSVEEYSYHEDTTTLLDNQDDIELEYDDATFNPDEDPIANGFTGHPSRPNDEQAEDDMPPLPEDMSSLPVLHAADLRLGMIIAWKQLLCTEATQWQPQLSAYMAACVTETREGSANFQVQLARRDRDIDRNVKKYDKETGQRVYGKFEAPDSDEDADDGSPEEEDDGIRELFFPEMIEPRIVQQAAELDRVDKMSQDSAKEKSFKSGEPQPTTPQLPELGFEVADSQPKQRMQAESLDHSGTLENEPGTEKESVQRHGHRLSIDDDATVEESFVSETIQDQLNLPAQEVSITDYRRGEINELIKEGGFRQKVRSSINQSAFLQFGQGSPSRQLEEEYASSILVPNHVDTSTRASSSEAPSEYDAREPMQYGNAHSSRSDFDSTQPLRVPSPLGDQKPSQQGVNQIAAEMDGDTFHSAPQTPSLHQMPADRENEEDSTRLIAPDGQDSTGKVEYPKLNASQNTHTSSLSGRRQLDPNFISHSDDLGISLPGDSPMMNAFQDDDTALVGEPTEFDQPESERMPTQQMYNDELENANGSGTPFRTTKPHAQTLSRPQSAASNRSDSSFPDIKFLSSQVALTRVNELPEIKTERRSSKDISANDDLPPQPPRLRQHAEVSSLPRAVKWTPHELQATLGTESDMSGIKGGNTGSNNVSFQKSISPPALSRSRQTRASSSSQDTSRDKIFPPIRSAGLSNPSDDGLSIECVESQTKKASFTIPKGSQVVNLMTSSPEPEPEPEYSEMYEDDSIDGDYESSFPKTRKLVTTRRTSQASARGRRASVPRADKKDETMNPGWIGGRQGPSRKATDRFGGRMSSAGGFL